MQASLSLENRIQTGLLHFKCAASSFVEISKRLGVQISSGFLSEAFAGKRTIDNLTGEKLMAILDRMSDLESAVAPVPVAWERVDRVTDSLALRLVAKFANDTSVDQAAQFATQRIINVPRHL